MPVLMGGGQLGLWERQVPPAGVDRLQEVPPFDHWHCPMTPGTLEVSVQPAPPPDGVGVGVGDGTVQCVKFAMQL
jgi:hypothetical protein